MSVQRFYDRYTAVRAIRYTGENADEVIAWGAGRVSRGGDTAGTLLVESRSEDYKEVFFHTNEAAPGDWVVLRNGTYGPVGGEDFARLYEPAGPPP